MVGTRWAHHGRHFLQRRTRRLGYLRISRLPNERWPLLRNEIRRPFLHWPRPRQLGRGRRTVRLPPFPRRGTLRQVTAPAPTPTLALAQQENPRQKLLLRPVERHIL